jgi:hypothetical protein
MLLGDGDNWTMLHNISSTRESIKDISTMEVF